jgi:hypothetical protein
VYFCTPVGEREQRKHIDRDLLGEWTRVAVPRALAAAQRLLGAREESTKPHSATGRTRLLEPEEF